MDFENELISGSLIKRYKRFFVDIKINNKTVTCHCPNTGSMMGLLDKNNKVWVSKSNNLNRKLQYTLQIIEKNKCKIGVNTLLTNKIFFEALENDKINSFKGKKKIKREFKFNSNTRFDFFIEEQKAKSLIEVKNVTLSRKKGIAEFPDAVTARGFKHIEELLKASNQGYKIYLVFIIQRNDCDKIEMAKDIDPDYNNLLIKAVKKKLNVLCYDCKFSAKGIKLNQEIELKLK